jgi:hypothetical protein
MNDGCQLGKARGLKGSAAAVPNTRLLLFHPWRDSSFELLHPSASMMRGSPKSNY